MARERPNLYGLDRGGILAALEPARRPRFHAGQIYRWMYRKRILEPDRWSDLPKGLREDLSARHRVDPGTISGRAEAGDGTVKYRIELSGGGSAEAVYMVQDDRITLCLSSQEGCALGCSFCLTAKMGLRRNLDAGEILGQVHRILEDRGADDRPCNIVFMGMGEPLHNYEAVLRAVGMLTDPEGGGRSRKRITLSTAGLAPAIRKLAGEPVRPLLAVSLNATTDPVRDRLMPINRRYPLAVLLEACRTYSGHTGEQLTFEYVLLDGVNDTPEDVRRLAGIVRDQKAKLNLIPFNPVPGWLDYAPPKEAVVRRIRDSLLDAGIPVSIRWSRGRDARAACGQLAMLD